MFIISLYLHCTSTSIEAAIEVPTELVAEQLYDPDLFRGMLGIVKFDPLWNTLLGLSVWNQFHVKLVFGLASVTLHSNVAVFPSWTLYGLVVVEETSGLSVKNK